MILACETLWSTKDVPVIETFVRLFSEPGLPAAIRSDNGLPFASPSGLCNLSKLSVFWLGLGMAIERIKPGNPRQNGRHERMRRTLKQETTRPPGLWAVQSTRWCPQRDSNPRPPDYKSDALPAEL